MNSKRNVIIPKSIETKEVKYKKVKPFQYNNSPRNSSDKKEKTELLWGESRESSLRELSNS